MTLNGLPPPREVLGVLVSLGAKQLYSVGKPAPYILMAEHEVPSAPGVTPHPFAPHAPENLQYVGAYWLTWFGLAGAVAGVYAAMLWRRYHPKPVPPPKPVPQ